MLLCKARQSLPMRLQNKNGNCKVFEWSQFRMQSDAQGCRSLQKAPLNDFLLRSEFTRLALQAIDDESTQTKVGLHLAAKTNAKCSEQRTAIIAHPA